ncbi:hypothetical protein fugu_007207 [Takifugu bimaculatus]|uniref:Interleukin-7 n=1 Tax=Takifugu bimaculatus TaxID=433685 RepID=A0A4Z2B499_9TELE|nr:hypothetical protein fugu_007207 [Takifugu bimaculatus]
MCLTGTLLRTVLLVLLVSKTDGKHRCNYKEILGSYTGVIFVELQNLNLTDTCNTSRERDLCPSKKVHGILLSIFDIAHRTRCQTTGKQQLNLAKPLYNMEHLIIQNCNPKFLRTKAPCSSIKRIQRENRKKKKLIRITTALITCWQKLQTLFTGYK